MQPYVFPYIGYYQLVNAVDNFVFLDDVNFINKGWINRNNILVNGRATLFTIPLKDASQNRLINEIKVADVKGLSKILRSIEMTYKKSPQFLNVFPLIETIFQKSGDLISEIAKESVKEVFNYLDIKKKITDSSDKYNNNNLKGQDRIIDIAVLENASEYYNPIGGVELYEPGKFKEKEIELHFLKNIPVTYKQQGVDFVPFLSIIDVLMYNSKIETKEMLKSYELL